MDLLRDALKGQYHAGLAMLRQCIDRCPEDVWLSGEHPRNYWRIAAHTIYFTDVYLRACEADHQLWPGYRDDCDYLWDNPPVVEPYPREVMLQYLDHVDALVDPTVDALDLTLLETGFSWYPNMTKLDHELMNLRHLQGHVGQLSELLMAQGVDIDWIAIGKKPLE